MSSQSVPNRVRIYETLYRDAISISPVNFSYIQKLAESGVPDGLRPDYWRVLLHLVESKDPADWEREVTQKVETYVEYLDDLYYIQSPAEATSEDHPLSTTEGSRWNQFFQDTSLLNDIAKDSCRTCPYLHIFRTSSPASQSDFNQSKYFDSLREGRASGRAADDTKSGGIILSLVRVLFLFAKLNPSVGYIQGLNDITAPLLFTFYREGEEKKCPLIRAEALAFFSLVHVTQLVQNNFIYKFTDKRNGVGAQIVQLEEGVKANDFELWSDFAAKGVDFAYFSFRWFQLLFCREFHMPDTQKLWDWFFSCSDYNSASVRFAVALLLEMRPLIFHKEYEVLMEELMAVRVDDISRTIVSAKSLTIQQETREGKARRRLSLRRTL